MATQELWEAETGGGVSHIIKRPRLTKILDESEARIILLCAPAGYGKTTLAREWVATRDEPVLWYSGGPAMADVAALAVDLAELFAGAESALAEKVRFLAARGEDPRGLAKTVAREAPPAKALVVIDDYHYAEESSAAEQFVVELMATTRFRLLLGSRIRPAWIDARELLYARALSISPGLLSFTPDEAAAVAPNGASVIDQAYGWPALIGLAAFQGEPSAEGEALSPGELYDFVAQHLFSTTHPDLRRALLVLAAGGIASRQVARELLGAKYEEVLQSASDRGLVTRHSDRWATMHPLLRRVLLRELSDLAESQRADLVTRVTTILLVHHEWDECLSLMCGFPEEKLAADVMRRALYDLLDAGRTATVTQWVELARDAQFTDPIFSLAAAEVALRAGRTAEAFSLAKSTAPQLRDDLAARALLATARASHHRDDVTSTFDYAERAAERAASMELKTEALWLAVASAYEREPERLTAAFERLVEVNDPRPEHALRVACAHVFVNLTDKGNVLDALASASEAVSLSAHIRDPLLRTNALNLRCFLLRVNGNYDAALQASEELLVEAEKSGLGFVFGHALLGKASALVGLRALAASRKALRALDAQEGTSDHVRHNAVMLRARLRVAAGDIPGALLALSTAVPEFPFTLRGEFLALRALIAAAGGDSSAARDSLAAATEAPRYEEVAAYKTLAESILQLRKVPSPDAAAAAIRPWLRLGNSDAVVTACRAYPELARLAVMGGLGTELEQLFGKSNDTDLGRSAGLRMPRELRRHKGISKREREVWELLVQGRTNADIARTLFISESTVKVHIRHIFEKLGVHTRAEAAAASAQIVDDG